MPIPRGPTARGTLVFDGDHTDAVIGAIRGAVRSVWIATANLKQLMIRGRAGRYHSILELLDALVSRGVSMRILHAAVPSRPFRDAFDGHPRLFEGGLELRQCARVHLKTVIVDGRFLYLGSANFTGAGLGAKGEHRRNFELGLVTGDCDTIDAVQVHYDGIWRGLRCRGCRLREICEAPLDLPSTSTAAAGPVVRLRRPGRGDRHIVGPRRRGADPHGDR